MSRTITRLTTTSATAVTNCTAFAATKTETRIVIAPRTRTETKRFWRKYCDTCC